MIMGVQEEINLKAKRYSSIKYCVEISKVIYLLILLFIFLDTGLSIMLRNEILQLTENIYVAILMYGLIVFIIHYLLEFPLNIYCSYHLEHRFSLSTQKIKDWLIDQIKTGLISFVIFIILTEAFYFILRKNPQQWWWIVSLFWIFFSLTLAGLMPTLIIPLFFKYKILSDAHLRQRILNLAEKMKLKLLDVFEIDFSKKTVKANAAFVGLGRTKRVILADTLKDKYTHDEIEVILAHEFAHYKMKHLLKLVFVNSLVIISAFYLMSQTSRYVLGIFGLSSLNDIAAFPAIVMYLVAITIILEPLMNYVSRRFEKNADKLAIKTTNLKEAFISMMEKLCAQNLADREPPWLIKVFFFDHPPVSERIAFAENLVIIPDS